MKSGIGLLLWCVFVLTPFPVHGQSPPAWLVEKGNFLDTARKAACPNPAEPRQCAENLLAAAEARFAQGLPWSTDLFHSAAMAFLDINAVADAIVAFSRLEAVTASVGERAYAACVQGELLYREQFLGAALAAFQRCTALIEAEGIHKHPRTYARACLGEAEVHRRNQNLMQAITARSRVLNQPWTPLLDPESHVGMAYVRNARDHFAMGHVDTGRWWFDAFFQAMPNLGSTDGRAVLFRLERAIAGRELRTIDDEPSVHDLVGLWADQTWWSYPEIMAVASSLESVRLNRQEQTLLVQHLASARARFNAHEAQWRTIGGDRFVDAVDDFAAMTVHYMALLLQDRQWALVKQVGDDLLERYPLVEERDFVKRMIAEAEANLP